MFKNRDWHGYKFNPKFSKKVAYFCMEYAIEQPLKIYSGGLGFLAGSHMRSAYDLKQNLVGVGMLWKYGYYDQVRDENQYMQPRFIRKDYHFLEDIGLTFPIMIHGSQVFVKVWYLAPEVFGTAPMFFLSTDIPENDYLSKTITNKLYDSDTAAKIASSIVLGVGGARALELLGIEPDIYHMNEGHALPLTFHLYSRYKSVEELKKHFVFTTHTPELAGNEEHPLALLHEMTFFNTISLEEAKKISLISGSSLNYTLTALRFAKIANSVSKIHGKVSNEMWGKNEGICKITSITNAQNRKYWVDPALQQAFEKNDDKALLQRKKEMKKELFQVVADQTGKVLDPEVLTIVWARRFAGYKRADLILQDWDRFFKLVSAKKEKIQVIWAGKPYPEDHTGIYIFNNILDRTRFLRECAVLTGYELRLSALLKRGADVWLNTPRYPREASGTSGMTAAMNGTINFSIADGWIPEFIKHGENGFVIKPADTSLSIDAQDYNDNQTMMKTLESEVVPCYYGKPDRWLQIIKNGMKDVYPEFDSDRMATEYYEKLYN